MNGPRERRPFWHLRRPLRVVDADIDEELRLHIDLKAAEFEAGGVPADEARREAVRAFGDLEATRRYCRQQDVGKEKRMQRSLAIEDFVQDLRLSARSLARAPLLTLTIVATVGLGVGATTATFGGVHAALLRPLPYHDPSRLYRLFTDSPPFTFRFSMADYLALQEQQTHFERIAAFTESTVSYSSAESADVARGRTVSWTYFGVLGISPALGRDFAEADGRPGAPRTVIVSHGFWEQRLGGRPAVVGQSIRLDGREHELVGVLPPLDTPLERRPEFFVAGQFTPPPRRGPFLYTVIARLRPDVDPAAAASELRAINRRIFPMWRSSYQDDAATWAMEDLRTAIVGDVSAIAGLALGAVGLVWLIACANASSLLLARVTSRQRELAVRAALGASRGRLVRFLVAESALLALASVAIGFVIAWAGMALLRDVGSSYFPRMQEIALDGPVISLLVGLGVMSALLCGLMPAMHGGAGRVDASLRSEGRSVTGSSRDRHVRRALVAAQFAMTTPLLVVAALLLASLGELRQVELGLDTQNVVSGEVRLPAAFYAQPPQAQSFWDELGRRLDSLPGVAGVAFADGRPPSDVGNIDNFDLEERPTPPGQSQPATPWVAVTPEYFRVTGLELLEGRPLERRDAETESLESVVVDRAWARRFFPGDSAVGKRFREGGCTTCPWTSVVGVVSDVKYMGIDRPDDGTVYWPLAGSLSRFVVIRTYADPATVLPAVRKVLQALEPAAPFSGVASFDELIDRSLEQPRSLSTLVGAFAVLALLLSVIGIYGVMGYYVQQHVKEIGIRMALGGTRSDVGRLVVGQGMRVVVVGLGIGVLAALASTRWVAALLFGVEPRNPWTIGAVCALMLSVALVACLLPARRAVRLEPAIVLRNE